MSAPRNEQKYFMLRLIHSGRTLREAKALMYAVATGLHPEYTASGDLKDLQDLEGWLSRIGMMTRANAKRLSFKRLFRPRNILVVSLTLGSVTSTFWKRRASALAFSKIPWYS